MTRKDFDLDVRSFIENITDDQLSELWGMMEEHAEDAANEAVDGMADEDELFAQFERDYEIPGFVFNDLSDCIRLFDDDPMEAKRLLSRALKDLPGGPKWLD